MNLQIGVKVLLQNPKGNFLLIQRTELLQNEATPSWDIPGGRIESDESLEAALAREIQEEIGVEFNPSSPPHLVNAQDIFVYPKELHVVRLTYVVEYDLDIQHISLSDEHQRVRWASLEEARNIVTEPFLRETLLDTLS